MWCGGSQDRACWSLASCGNQSPHSSDTQAPVYSENFFFGCLQQLILPPVLKKMQDRGKGIDKPNITFLRTLLCVWQSLILSVSFDGMCHIAKFIYSRIWISMIHWNSGKICTDFMNLKVGIQLWHSIYKFRGKACRQSSFAFNFDVSGTCQNLKTFHILSVNRLCQPPSSYLN